MLVVSMLFVKTPHRNESTQLVHADAEQLFCKDKSTLQHSLMGCAGKSLVEGATSDWLFYLSEKGGDRAHTNVEAPPGKFCYQIPRFMGGLRLTVA